MSIGTSLNKCCFWLVFFNVGQGMWAKGRERSPLMERQIQHQKPPLASYGKFYNQFLTGVRALVVEMFRDVTGTFPKKSCESAGSVATPLSHCVPVHLEWRGGNRSIPESGIVDFYFFPLLPMGGKLLKKKETEKGGESGRIPLCPHIAPPP